MSWPTQRPEDIPMSLVEDAQVDVQGFMEREMAAFDETFAANDDALREAVALELGPEGSFFFPNEFYEMPINQVAQWNGWRLMNRYVSGLKSVDRLDIPDAAEDEPVEPELKRCSYCGRVIEGYHCVQCGGDTL